MKSFEEMYAPVFAPLSPDANLNEPPAPELAPLRNFEEEVSNELRSIYRRLRKAEAENNMRLYWEIVRGLFDFRETELVPINSANLCPSFDYVARKSNEFRLLLNRNVSIQHRVGYFGKIIDQTKADLARALKINPADLALTRNATEANNILNNGIDLKPNDVVILWEENHGTNREAWVVRFRRAGKDVENDLVKVSMKGVKTPGEAVTRFANAIRAAKGRGKNVRFISWTEISAETGMRMPSREIIQMIHELDPERKIHIHIDGAQSWGSRSLDLIELDCDSLAGSAHKWFLGPKETGILYIKKSKVADFWPSYFGYDAKIKIGNPHKLKEDAQRFETLGQRDDPNLMALRWTQALHNMIRPEKSEARILELSQFLRRMLNTIPELEAVTPSTPGMYHGVVIYKFKPKTVKPESPGAALYNYLYGKGIGVAASVGVKNTSIMLGIRLCPHIYNTTAHLERAVKEIRNFIRENKAVAPAKTSASHS